MVFIILGLLLVVSCSAADELGLSAGPDELRKLDICHSARGGNSVHLEHALQNGYFEKQGFDVTLHAIDGGANATRALVAGDFDICSIGGSNVANAAVSGEELIFVSGIISKLPYSLITKPDVTRPDQLQGQPLAISTHGSSSDTAIRMALEGIGLDPDEDVFILTIGGQSERIAALEGGSVAGTVVSVPESILTREMGYNILLDMSELDTPYQHTALVTRREVIETDRDMVQGVVQAVVESILAMKDDRQGTTRILAELMLMDEKEDAIFLNEAYDALVQKYYDPYLNPAGISWLLEAAKTDNPMAINVPVDSLVDASFIQELEERGILPGDQ